MKKYFIIIVSILFSLKGVYSQRVYSEAEKQQIADIDKIRNEINKNLGTYRKIDKIADSTGSRYVYTQNQELKLITVQTKDNSLSGKIIDKKVDWYFSNNQLIYSEQLWTDIVTSKIVDNQKFYLNNQHLLSWIQFENKIVDNASEEFKDCEIKLTSYGIQLCNSNK